MELKHRPIVIWLLTVAAAVFLMALIGAVTRLTESGLSIVDWRPVAGVVPPLNAAQWQTELEKYRTSPQYQKINSGMSLDEFQDIYFWEWIHRFWGRMIGALYALPLLWFWRQGQIPTEKKKYFLGILGLGFLQGAMGWYMVKSGLVDEPAVSHYRLAAHLLLAFVIYGCLLRLGLVLLYPSVGAEQPVTKLRGLVRGTIVFAAVVMLWGAFVAGLDAGLLYNSFPTMNGYWFPPETAQYVPVWKAFFEEPATVQWTHRILAMLFFAKVVFLFRRGQSFGPSPVIRKLLWAVLLATVLQMILGILTLLSQVNIVLATMHQAGALLLLTSLIALLHFIPRKDKT